MYGGEDSGYVMFNHLQCATCSARFPMTWTLKGIAKTRGTLHFCSDKCAEVYDAVVKRSNEKAKSVATAAHAC